MILNLPDPSEFFIKTKGNLTLITPKPIKQAWDRGERVYRSVIIENDFGEVVSTGFPKFMNYGEDDYDTEVFNRDLPMGDIWFTEKIDGSLCIRSVIDGKVVLRTRGTFDGGDFKDAMWECAAKYPMLLDPTYFPGQSLLFEFVHPGYRVILDYEPDLIFLGGIEHTDLRLWDPIVTDTIAHHFGLNLVPFVNLPMDERALAIVSEYQGREGIVARCGPRGDTLVKLKSAEYLLKHRLKFALTPRRIRDICLERDMYTLEDFSDYLKEIGGDWELAIDAKPIVLTVFQARAKANARFISLKRENDEMRVTYPDRKDFALSYALHLEPFEKSAAFCLLDGQDDKAYFVLERHFLDEALKDMEEPTEA